MSAKKAAIPWVEANQAYLVAEFARLKHQLAAKPEAPDAAAIRIERAVAKARKALKRAPAIDRLSELFGLSEFERQVLLLCAGVEMDSKLAAQCAEAQGHPQRTYATFGLAMATFPDPHWSALTPSRPLRRSRMIEVETGHGLTSAPLRIDERTLHYLAGVNGLDPRLEGLLQASPLPSWIASEHKLTAHQTAGVLQAYETYAPVVHLCGDDPNGQEDVAALTAQTIGRQLFVVRIDDLPGIGPDLDQFIVLWQREALLVPAALLIQCGSQGLSASARPLAERLQGVVFVASREPVRFNRALPSLRGKQTAASGTEAALAAGFRFGSCQVQRDPR